LHVVLEVDDTNPAGRTKEAVERTLEAVRARAAQFGEYDPLVERASEGRIVLRIPDFRDAERAKSRLTRVGLLEFRFILENSDLTPVLRDLDAVFEGIPVEEADGGTADSSRATDPEDGDTGFDSLLSTLPLPDKNKPQVRPVPVRKAGDPAFTTYIISAVGGGVVVDERVSDIVAFLLGTRQAEDVLPRRAEFLWESQPRPLEGGGRGRLLYLVEAEPVLTGSSIVDAAAVPDPDAPDVLTNVTFVLDEEGASTFRRITGRNIGRRLAIVLDGMIQSAPVIQSEIPSGEARITGNFSFEEAEDLAIILRSGALAVAVRVVEAQVVGPTQ
jgi:SecD/SecF fusion protein